MRTSIVSQSNYSGSVVLWFCGSVVHDEEGVGPGASNVSREFLTWCIGQGIEPAYRTGRFDYCCVHGVLAAKELGYETIMINCNPETVSTDFDTADKLYFEPVFWEHIYDIILHEQPEGVIVQVVCLPSGSSTISTALSTSCVVGPFRRSACYVVHGPPSLPPK
jgi:hypothetical protein